MCRALFIPSLLPCRISRTPAGAFLSRSRSSTGALSSLRPDPSPVRLRAAAVRRAVPATMSLTFYHAPMSTASITEEVLAELAVPVDVVKVDLKAGETKKPDFLKINPNGKVPVIVHDGAVIWESAAITIYLGEVFGEKAGLYPAAGPKRGEAMKWIVWGNVSLAGATMNIFEPGCAEKAKGEIASCFQVLDSALNGKDFVNGEYSLVDTHLQCVVHWISSMDVDMKPYHNIAAWLKRCLSRPALAKLAAASAQ